MKKNLRNVLLYIAIPIILIISIMSVSRLTKNTAQTKYYQIVDMISNNEISEFQLNLYSGELVYTLREDGKKYRYTVADSSIFYNPASCEYPTQAHPDRVPQPFRDRSVQNSPHTVPHG